MPGLFCFRHTRNNTQTRKNAGVIEKNDAAGLCRSLRLQPKVMETARSADYCVHA